MLQVQEIAKQVKHKDIMTTIAVIKETPKGYIGVKVSKRFSANKKSEQQRLAKEFSNEPDVVICVTSLY